MTQMTLQQALDLAMRHHEAGRLGDAEKIYRQILAAQPAHADALHLLGVVALQSGKPEPSVQLIQRAIELQPDFPEAHYNLGVALRQTRRLDPAIAAFRQAVALRPNYPDAWNSLGDALHSVGRLDEAVAAFRQAMSFKPDFAGACYNLGNALNQMDRKAEAIEMYRRAIAIQPGFAQAYNNLANVLNEIGNPSEAIAMVRRALALQPDFPEAWNNLAHSAFRAGQMDESLAAARRAVALKPDFVEALSNVGNALRAKGQLDDAMAPYRQAIAINPNDAVGYSNLGTVWLEKGCIAEATAAYRQAIAVKSDFPLAHYNLALTLLLQGDFQNGWVEHEWRWKVTEHIPLGQEFDRPQWDGSELAGRRILLHAEQGLGDGIQFVRYLPMVRQRGGKISLQCPRDLLGLFREFPDVEQLLARGDRLPEFDVHCPLISLPGIFKTDLSSIPADVPYLHAQPEKSEKWRARLAECGDRFKVGLAWAGRPEHDRDASRSILLKSLAPLAKVSDVCFPSLQKGDPARQVQSPDHGLDLFDWTADLRDFTDTAALIENLDLVITVDTAVAHLAGALGKRVWVMVSFIPDWRWMLDRADSPWYPTMRLFRQPAIGDWPRVIRDVADALQLVMKEKQ